MAHQNLPFTFNMKNKKWQPIFGNQELGTFFMVYMKINSVSEKYFVPSIKSHVCNVTFKIQNFRGAITMGLIGTPSQSLNERTEKEKYDLSLGLKVSPYTKSSESLPFDIITTEEIQEGFIFDTLVEVLGVPDIITDIKNNEVNYIDPREYERNGDTLNAIITIDNEERKTILNELDEYSIDALKIKLESILTKEGAGGGSGICCPRRSVVI